MILLLILLAFGAACIFVYNLILASHHLETDKKLFYTYGMMSAFGLLLFAIFLIIGLSL